MTFGVRILLFCVGLLASLAVGACASDAVDVVAVAEPEAEAESAEPVQLDDPPSPTLPQSTTTTTTSSTTSVAPSTTTSTADPSNEEIEVLGEAMVGIGEWVAIRPAGEPLTDCDNSTTLGYAVDGTIVHRYDDLGGLGGIRLFPGPYGQDAFVVNCEESVERIVIQGSGFIPEQGWPELADFAMYGPGSPSITFEFSTDFGWRSGWFTAHGTDTSTDPAAMDLYGFDTASETIITVADRIGKRTSVDVLGADLIVPTGWTFDGSSTEHRDSFSRVQVIGEVDPAVEPVAEGEDFLSSDSADVRIWSTPDADGRASVVRVVTATDWTFLSDDGVRMVRLIPLDDRVIEIELFSDAGDGTIDRDLPWLVLDTVRVFDS